MIVKMHQAKSQLSSLIARVEAGEEVILARGDTPVAKIVPLSPSRREPRTPGALKHLRGAIPDDLFLRPMTEEELAAWEGTDMAKGEN